MCLVRNVGKWPGHFVHFVHLLYMEVGGMLPTSIYRLGACPQPELFIPNRASHDGTRNANRSVSRVYAPIDMALPSTLKNKYLYEHTYRGIQVPYKCIVIKIIMSCRNCFTSYCEQIVYVCHIFSLPQ